MFKRLKKNTDSEGGEMTFLEHLEEMRGVILRALAVFMVTFFIVLAGFHYFNALMMYPLNSAKRLLATVYAPSVEEHKIQQKLGPVFLVDESGEQPKKIGPYYIVPKDDTVTLVKDSDGENAWIADIKLRAMSFATPITIYFYVGALGAAGISLPIILYLIAGFIAPGLTAQERKMLRPGMVAGIFLFCMGSAFAFFFMLPMGLAFMTWLSAGMQLEMFPDAQSYYTLVIFATIAIGFTFELPLVLTILIYLGVVKVEWLKGNRRMVFLIILIFATVVTPPDCITQISLTIPLYLMYEIALAVGVRLRRRKLAREAAEERKEEIKDAEERKEYAKIVAKERLAEQEKDVSETAETSAPAATAAEPDYDDPAKYEIDTSHYAEQDYGYNETYGEEDEKIDSYIDYGRMGRTAPQFGPDWNLNRPDTSFMAPDWDLNADAPEAKPEIPNDSAPKDNQPKDSNP